MNNNQFQTRQWEQQYAKHKRSVEQIEHRNYKFPDQVEEIIQRQKDANKRFKIVRISNKKKCSPESQPPTSYSLRSFKKQKREGKSNSLMLQYACLLNLLEKKTIIKSKLKIISNLKELPKLKAHYKLNEFYINNFINIINASVLMCKKIDIIF